MVNVRWVLFIVNDKLKVVVINCQFSISLTCFLAFCVPCSSLQVLMLLLRWFDCPLFLCVRWKFFLIFYLRIICKMVKFTWVLLNRRFHNLRTIIDEEGMLMLSYFGVSLFWSSAVRELSSVSRIHELIVLPSLPFFINNWFFYSNELAFFNAY